MGRKGVLLTERVSAAEWRAGQVKGMSEKEFQGHVLDLARHHGWLCYHTFDSRRSQPGFPDLVMVRADRLLFAELKTEKGKLSAEQDNWINVLREFGNDVVANSHHFYPFVWRPSDLPEIERVLK